MTLDNLNFINSGQVWPPESERVRLDRYEANKKAFNGEHSSIFRGFQRIMRATSYWNGRNQVYDYESFFVVLNWHKRISVLWADLLVGEQPEISSSDENMDEVIKATDLINKIHTSVIDYSRYGDTVIKLIKLPNGKIKIVVVDPSLWFPVYDPATGELTYQVLAWTNKEKTILEGEIHEPGKITTFKKKLDPQTGVIGSNIDEPITLSTGLNEWLIFNTSNLETSDSLYGHDDYTDLDTIIEEIEIRVSQIAKILDKHAEPDMYGPASDLEVDPGSGAKVYNSKKKYHVVANGDEKPGYLVWDGNLEASFKELEFLIEQFYVISETSPALFGQLKAGLAESGSALKRLLIAPLAKVSRIRTKYDPLVKQLIQTIYQLQNQTVSDISIGWKDGIPDDEVEEAALYAQKVTAEVARITAGLTTPAQAIARLDGISVEEANRLALEIEKERQASNNDQSQQVNPNDQQQTNSSTSQAIR